MGHEGANRKSPNATSWKWEALNQTDSVGQFLHHAVLSWTDGDIK